MYTQHERPAQPRGVPIFKLEMAMDGAPSVFSRSPNVERSTNSVLVMSSDVQDVSARRTWDREEAEKHYKERLAREKAEAK